MSESETLLTALRAHGHPVTARQAGQMIGVSRHRARDLLNRLLQAGTVGWRPDGWIATAQDAPPADQQQPRARDPRADRNRRRNERDHPQPRTRRR